jgi:hypothetical protein
LEAAHVAFELSAGEPAAAADVDRVQLAGLHQRIDGRAPNPEDLGGFFGRQQQGIAGQHVAERLRITHVHISWSVMHSLSWAVRCAGSCVSLTG